MNNKKIIITVLTLSILALGATSLVPNVYAEESVNTQDSLFQRIIERFNLNNDEVDEVVDTYREEMHERHRAEAENRLDEAVSNGDLTQQQRDIVAAKMSEWHENKPDFSQMTWEEKREAATAHRDEMHAWAEAQGIDMDSFRSNMRGPRHGSDEDYSERKERGMFGNSEGSRGMHMR